jgi:hypothetical protein
MSVALRDQRVRVYGYDNSGTEGRISESYPFVGEYWARITSPSGREKTIAGQAEHTADALVFFSDEVASLIPADGILKLGTIVYKILAAPVASRMYLNEVVVPVVHAESANYVLA